MWNGLLLFSKDRPLAICIEDFNTKELLCGTVYFSFRPLAICIELATVHFSSCSFLLLGSMPKSQTKFLNNKQRQIVRMHLARRQELNQHIPFAKLIKLQMFRDFDIQRLKTLVKNEERCVQDEERRKQVMASKRVRESQRQKQVKQQEEELNALRATLKKQEEEDLNQRQKQVLEDMKLKRQEEELNALRATLKKQEEEDLKLRAQHEVEVSRIRLQLQEKSTEQQVDAGHLQILVNQVIQKDKQLKDHQKKIETQRLRINELYSECQESLEKHWQSEEEKRELEQDRRQAEKDREYFEKCSREWHHEYDQLHERLNRGYDRTEHWDMYQKMNLYRFKLDSLSFATSVEQEIRYTVQLIHGGRGKNVRAKSRMTMNEMRELILSEGNELVRQDLISGDGEELSHRIEEYWKVRNQMSHENGYVYRMNHEKFQRNARWITKQLQILQGSLQKVHYSYNSYSTR